MEPRFWIGLRNAILPSLALWALIYWAISSLFFSGCAHRQPWSPTDKALFASVIVVQVSDYIVTEKHLDQGGHIDNAWSWQYGTSRPSDSHLALIKAAELGAAYLIADALPSKPRKGFLALIDGLLSFGMLSWHW